jgi:hypothetical protein
MKGLITWTCIKPHHTFTFGLLYHCTYELYPRHEMLPRLWTWFSFQEVHIKVNVVEHIWRAMPSPGFNCCTTWTLYAHNLNLVCSTLCIVERGSNNSREARRVDFVGHNFSKPRVDFVHTVFRINHIYRCPRRNCARLREGVAYGKVYLYNQKHLCPKFNGYGDKCGLLAGPRIVPISWHALSMFVLECGMVLRHYLPVMSCIVLGTLRTTMTCVRVFL